MQPSLPAPRSPLFAVGLLTLLFFAATGGAWAWYHVAPRTFPVAYSFKARSEIAGFKFEPEPLSGNAIEVLATTNLFNGAFTGQGGRRYLAFMGTWDGQDSKQLSVVGHTPDICWIGTGWTHVPMELPDKMNLQFGFDIIPFEVRVFKAPQGNHLELTVWATLVSGQLYEEVGRFNLPDSAPQAWKARSAFGARHVLKGQLFKAIRDRIPGTGSKQFVRFSTPLKGNLNAAIEELRRFGEQWLELKAEQN